MVGATKSQPVQNNSVNSAPLYVVSLVDDDASVRRSVSRLLESDGFSVLAFSEPKQFLEHLQNYEVAVAVLDIWMDQMTGMELLAHLCAKSPNTRVIFITGQEDPAARVTVLQGGAFAFFMKPFDDTAFLSAVRQAFLTLPG
jgi:FixJ family two-component response regulator